jgi:hypothetical protein
MHEEFLLFHKSKEPAKTADKSEEWEEVGKKNKSSIVLTVFFSYFISSCSEESRVPVFFLAYSYLFISLPSAFSFPKAEHYLMWHL